VTTTIKHSTAGVPSSLFLAVGLGGDGTVSNRSFQRRGKWATLSFDMLITGLHNRLIKVGTIRKIAGPCVGSAAGISNRPLVDTGIGAPPRSNQPAHYAKVNAPEAGMLATDRNGSPDMKWPT
jgi:hypothetical protein